MRSQGAVWPGPEAPLPAFTSGQKPDPGLMANCRGQPFSELLLQVLLVPSLPPSALHIKGRQRSLFTPHFTQMAPHRSTPPHPRAGPRWRGASRNLQCATRFLLSHHQGGREGDIAPPFF